MENDLRRWMRLVEAGWKSAPEPDAKFSKAFLQWFGNSKVVERGQPKVVYHGTPNVQHILQHGFKPQGSRGSVFFFSDSYAVANTYADDRRAFDYQAAEPHTIPVYLSLQNPMVIDGAGGKWRDTEKYVNAAREAGHDGIIITRSRDEYNNIKSGGGVSTVYAAFDPHQIKSALRTNLRSRVDKADLGRGNPETFGSVHDEPDD